MLGNEVSLQSGSRAFEQDQAWVYAKGGSEARVAQQQGITAS